MKTPRKKNSEKKKLETGNASEQLWDKLKKKKGATRKS